MQKWGFYIFAALIIFGGQFLASNGLVTGVPPAMPTTTLAGDAALARVSQGPALIYFWAEWCGICRAMQSKISAVSSDFPVLTVAVDSGDDATVKAYLDKNRLNWQVVNDADGAVFQRYGGRGVPALFFVNRAGTIVFTTAGYVSEWGLRLRLRLADLWPV